ncbi:IS1182 family transposase [Alicyclobacillus fastidiosus]|uniref:IS1182 family transposase n=1 Tax=Alicyclobacillus fastidiosus TaxID=392011 RepID=A0ABY6ZNE3_9BACL|nr:IS1182 family transposase [Alicyclobacillus fastidiosus]WAH44468.1 IS1182 family transposase [Alicyclobacillus fastidiosus]WAH44485.1 IS1182 family transposase [Alicyclobacillus fastidiosus]WAH44488.1 IS1182 family transposase [Alicyclobacillus fastidiosus]WAH44490.1 IS1182 family transposase [Alicyclobacillus fastidiosus]WAH44492.1 IS1182 family transposase [Alicyclobacillus fastidiosus]
MYWYSQWRLRILGKKFRDYDPNQLILLPPGLNEWLPDGHLANFVSDVVDHIDISIITKQYEQELRGFPPYHPAMLLKILVYAYCTGMYSSRKIAKACQDVVAFRVLSANQFPDFRTISDFRKRHLVTFKELFLEVLKIAQHAGMVKLGHVSLDGSKIRANASKHKAMSYERMKQQEQRLRQEIAELTQQAERTDHSEDKKYGNTMGDELPEELARRETRLAKIQEAMSSLEKEAKERVEQQQQKDEQQDKKDDDNGPTNQTGARKRGRPRKESHLAGVPEDKAQRNFTDPESRIMKSKDGFIQAYNVQAVVDEEYQIIVATDVIDHTNDHGVLRTMVEMTAENTKATMHKISCDAGYFAEDDVTWLQEKEIDPYIATGRQKHNEVPESPRGRIPKHYTIKQRMTRKLKTKKGRAVYARRKAIVEPVYGQIKGCRRFDQFSLRSLEKVRGEWSLVTMCHNLLKIFKYGHINWATC